MSVPDRLVGLVKGEWHTARGRWMIACPVLKDRPCSQLAYDKDGRVGRVVLSAL